MIRVRIDIEGAGARDRRLAELEIRNDQTGSAELGNYSLRLECVVDGCLSLAKSRMESWPRQDPSRSVVDLVAAALAKFASDTEEGLHG
jgi:hypothetical protein